MASIIGALGGYSITLEDGLEGTLLKHLDRYISNVVICMLYSGFLPYLRTSCTLN